MKNLIEIENLSYSYASTTGRPNRVLVDVSLTIQNGELVSITGASGSGKSTLINIIGLLTAPKGGRYWLGGNDMNLANERTREQLRSTHIGFIFQDYLLLDHLSALDNVLLPLQYSPISHRKKVEAAKEAMARLGLSGLEKRKPLQLSGGQKQRVAIARAIVNKPSLIIADEPGSALDPANRITVLRILQELVKDGSTVLMVTHSIDDAQFASRQIAIADGTIVKDELKVGGGTLLIQNVTGGLFTPLERFLFESGVYPIESVIRKLEVSFSLFEDSRWLNDLPHDVWRDDRFSGMILEKFEHLSDKAVGNIVSFLAEENLLNNKNWEVVLSKISSGTICLLDEGTLTRLLACRGHVMILHNLLPILLRHSSARIRTQCLSRLNNIGHLAKEYKSTIEQMCADVDTRVRCAAIECLEVHGYLPEFTFDLGDWKKLSKREWATLLRLHLKSGNRPPMTALLKALHPIWHTEDESLIVSTYFALSELSPKELGSCMEDMLREKPSLFWLARSVGRVVRRGRLRGVPNQEVA